MKGAQSGLLEQGQLRDACELDLRARNRSAVPIHNHSLDVLLRLKKEVQRWAARQFRKIGCESRRFDAQRTQIRIF
jgi:hypothetical protein